MRRKQCVISCLLVLGALGPVAACTDAHKGPPADPRAYGGSDRNVTLSAALHTCGFRVPATSSDLKYLTRKEWDGLVFLVRFTTDKAGYGDFLKSVGLTEGVLVPADSSAFDLDGTRLGWRLKAGRRYITGTGSKGLPSSATYNLTVDITDSSSPTVYVECITD
ncbi:hypothetical protein [Actinoallomurus rhizosphaericola]|uniref:hypothetical protein n=1 Tax=Actinoallomurus rhizosphaericola TaxID=2952536 RepID=UPI0020912EE6|nr:hypothetical protein [Actinoallomurus rhizosphaericola]MCO5992327.1 hypothetical protein [Actinoallomurus rhizosphaericola]